MSVAGLGLALSLVSVANASEIKQLRIETGATGTRAEVLLDATGPYKLIRLSNPERLVVDFPEGRFARGLSMPAGAGVVTSVRTGQPVAGTVRVVFDLSRPVAAFPARVDAGASGVKLVLEWPGDGPSAPVASASKPESAAPTVAKPAAPAPTAAVSAEPRPSTPTSAESPASTAPKPALTRQSPAQGATADVAQAPVASAADESDEPAAPAAPVVSRPPPMLMRSGMRPLVVAIDAGHGGQDTGALGGGGTREKDVTLAIARELARQVDATPGLKAYLTRDTDYFIPLPQRARKAHAARADIFISIHADSFTSPDARGAGVFVLSTRGASSQRARWLADKENAADVIGGDRVRGGDNVLTSVLLDLTQSGNMKASEDAAGYVLGNLDAIGNLHKGEVERANFAVLRTSDNMPAMLVETGFISNPGEEARLRSKSYQQQLASAILDGVNRYFTTQPPPGTLYALRARSGQDGGASGVGAGGSP